MYNYQFTTKKDSYDTKPIFLKTEGDRYLTYVKKNVRNYDYIDDYIIDDEEEDEELYLVEKEF